MPLPNETLDACRKADAVLLGAVGGPKWDALPVGKRPETGLLALRQGLGSVCQFAAGETAGAAARISPLKPERLGDLDIEIVRELAGGMYFGERGNVTEKGVERAFDTESYSTPEIERVADVRLCARRGAFAADVFGGQGQRAGEFATVAPHGCRHEHRASRRAPRTHVRGQRGDAVDAAADAVRRDAQHEHVRRYFERCRGGAGRLDRA